MYVTQTTEPTTPAGDLATIDSSRIQSLVIDDNSFDRQRLIRDCRAAELPIDFDEVATLAEMSAALDERAYDLVFIDYRLTDGNGLMAIDEIYAHPKHLNCATIMIAGTSDVEVAVNALKTGCSDYIVKTDVAPVSIQRAVVNAVQKSALRRDVASARGMNEVLERVLNKFASDVVTDMKPILSRMLRQARAMRQCGADTGGYAFDNEIEECCARLWTFLEGIEGYSKKLQH